MTHMRGEGARDQATSAREIENSVVRAGPGRLHDHGECTLIRDPGRRVERDRLTSELVTDQIVVRRGTHGLLLVEAG